MLEILYQSNQKLSIFLLVFIFLVDIDMVLAQLLIKFFIYINLDNKI